MKTVDFEVETRQANCPTHGEYVSRRVFGSIWSKCTACVAEMDARDKAEKAAEERAKLRLAWERKVGDAGIPERFRTRTLDTFIAETPDQTKALEFARAYAEDLGGDSFTGRCAMFLGRPGTGKTHLAVGIGLHAMNSGRSVMFTTVMRAIRRVKDTWVRGSRETETQAIEALVFPDLLILDEVGIQFGSEAEKLILFDVLNERYEKRKPALLLSNLTAKEVKAFLGERIYDRLREDGGAVIGFAWDSWRRSPVSQANRND